MSAAAVWDAFAAALASPHYQAAHRRVLRQLIEALLFEQVLSARRSANGQEGVYFDIPARAADGAPLHYRCHGRISIGFGRIRLDDALPLRVCAQGQQPAQSLQTFLLEAGAELDAEPLLLARLLRELQQTLLKDTLARHLRRPPAGARDATALEGQLQDGHPYHPCYKSRIGFDPLDNFAYGPEFQPALQLGWLALRRTQAMLTQCRDIDLQRFYLDELGAAQHARFDAALRARELAPADYLLLPVHPWQWRERIAPELFPLLQRHDLVWLGFGTDRYRPLQSIRSLANHSRPAAAHIKLPLDIVNTSAERILSCHNVQNAAPISDWLCAIRDRDRFLRDSGLAFQREVVGITYHDADLPPFLQAQQYGMLGAVWRESVSSLLRPGESAAPFSGLCQCEADGRPFIAPWIARHGLIPWLGALLQATLPPLIHLLYAHSIGMEAHAQNITLIHRDGLPGRIALKDLPGGLRFLRAGLAQPEHCPQLAPMPAFRRQANAAAGMEAASPQQVRDYFHDAVFFINCSELSFFLQRHYGLAEHDFWAGVAACIKRYQARHPALAARFAAFDLFAPTVLVEQLAKRRLYAETEARLQPVANPLRLFRRAAGPAQA